LPVAVVLLHLLLGLPLMLLLGVSLLLEEVLEGVEGVQGRAATGMWMLLACRAWWEPISA
jgi:hypothetical protein